MSGPLTWLAMLRRADEQITCAILRSPHHYRYILRGGGGFAFNRFRTGEPRPMFRKHMTQRPHTLVTVAYPAPFSDGGIVIVGGREIARRPVAGVRAAKEHVVI